MKYWSISMLNLCTLLPFVVACIILSCRHDRDQNRPLLEFTYLTDVEATNPRIRGIWKSIGNGYFLSVGRDSLQLYSYTSSFCYKEKNDYLEGLLNTQSQFKLKEDTLSIYLTDYGEHTTLLQTKKDFIKVDQLPEPCLSFSQMTRLDNQAQLQIYQETLQENYAFAAERELDWTSIFQSYQDLDLDSEKVLFETMGEIATLTKDQHTKVISATGRSLQYRVTPSALDVQASFDEQSQIESLDEYFGLFFSNNKSHIADSLLLGRGRKILGDNIQWGKLNNRIGYINILSFAGFLDRTFTRAQQIDSIRAQMKIIIDSLKTTEAMIVDISFNFGGFDASALTIASYFTDQARVAFTSQVFNDGIFYAEDEVIIIPASTRYLKPVYLLMTDISRSAAEGFAMMMDALPHVTLVGTNTLGTFSGMLGKSISQFYTTYSNQRLINAKGEYFEVTGIPPEIEIVVFPRENVMTGHLQAVRQIIGIIGE